MQSLHFTSASLLIEVTDAASATANISQRQTGENGGRVLRNLAQDFLHLAARASSSAASRARNTFAVGPRECIAAVTRRFSPSTWQRL
jgi:hypothetical protein